jgi:hypothetical protein
MTPDANPQEIKTFVQNYIQTSGPLESRAKRMTRALSTVEAKFEPFAEELPLLSNITSSQAIISVYQDALQEQVRVPGTASPEASGMEHRRDSKSFISDKTTLNIQLPMSEGSEFSKLFRILEEDYVRLVQLGILNWEVCRYAMDDAFNE